MDISANRDAMLTAAERFATAYARLGEVEAAMQRACTRAAAASGDRPAADGVVAYCDRLSSVLEQTCVSLLDIASGIRTALDAVWQAGGGGPGAGAEGSPPRPGRPQ